MMNLLNTGDFIQMDIVRSISGEQWTVQFHRSLPWLHADSGERQLWQELHRLPKLNTMLNSLAYILEAVMNKNIAQKLAFIYVKQAA